MSNPKNLAGNCLTSSTEMAFTTHIPYPSLKTSTKRILTTEPTVTFKDYTEENPCVIVDRDQFETLSHCKEAAHIKSDGELGFSMNPVEADWNDFWKNKETFSGPFFGIHFDIANLTFPLLRKAGSLQFYGTVTWPKLPILISYCPGILDLSCPLIS